MKSEFKNLSLIRQSAAVVVLVLAVAGCHRDPAPGTPLRSVDPLSLVLVPHPGGSSTDEQIRRYQEQVRSGRVRDAALEQLGWSFVTKARESFDPGFYKLAEQCAVALESRQPHGPEALLLRGHVLDSLHEFKA